MTKLVDVRLIDVLPESLAEDPGMAAIAYAIQPLLTKTLENAYAGDLWGRVNELTSAQLDHLAWQYDSAVWRDSWPIGLKRRVILDVLKEKTRRGTVWAIEQAVSALGSAVEVKTWFEQEPMGEPYTFDVSISVADAPNQSSAESQRDLMKAIDKAKAFRSHYTLTLAQQFAAAAGVYGVARPMVYRKLSAVAVAGAAPEIDPIGEEINGVRYAFKESTAVTGTGRRNSTITVNGQSVSVDAQGEWSTTVTLSAGQLHTITAIGADGQAAHASVYAWGELADANQLALIVGESAADVNTFTHATHTKYGVEYACISTVIKPVVAGWAQNATMPDKPWEYDKDAAMRALQSCVIDIRPRPANAAEIFQELGFEAIEEKEAT